MITKTDSEFSGLRSFLWPIHRHEVKKVIPMCLMLILICLNYSVLRNLKDIVVVTAQSSGAEVIPFIKVWVMLPMAFLMTYMFTKLTNWFSQEKVFFIIISFFLIFYTIFVFILYPARDVIHPHAFADWLLTVLPQGCRGLVAMWRNWSFTLFYVMCELWGTMVLTVLFWGFANEVTKIGEARRFYSVMGIGSNIAAAIAGQMANLLMVDTYNPLLPYGKDAWEQSMMQIVGALCIFGVITMVLFWWMNKNVLNNEEYQSLHTNLQQGTVFKTKKKKLSLRESFAYLSNSKYLWYIAILVVSYNLVINMVEVIWKDQARVLYPTPRDYGKYMNNLTTLMGIVSTLSALFLARIISRFGWSRTALVTPLIMLVTSLGFFGFFFMQDRLGDSFLAFMGMTPLAVAVFFGSAQNCFSKAAKYSFFDTTKEMAFIPLPHHEKLKGKAAIDGVGSRLGKSGGSFIHQGLLIIFITFANSAPYVAAVIIGVICLWIFAVRGLGKQFTLLVARQDPVALKELSDEEEEGLPKDSKPATAS